MLKGREFTVVPVAEIAPDTNGLDGEIGANHALLVDVPSSVNGDDRIDSVKCDQSDDVGNPNEINAEVEKGKKIAQIVISHTDGTSTIAYRRKSAFDGQEPGTGMNTFEFYSC
jgi:hypothetical protein